MADKHSVIAGFCVAALVARVAMLCLATPPAPPPPPAPAGAYFEVVAPVVTDADTLAFDYIRLPWRVAIHKNKIRCLGYDAPELHGQGVADDEKLRGAAAKLEFERLLGARNVRAYVREAASLDYDSFGRVLGFLYLRQPDGTEIDVARWMREHGHVKRAGDKGYGRF